MAPTLNIYEILSEWRWLLLLILSRAVDMIESEKFPTLTQARPHTRLGIVGVDIYVQDFPLTSEALLYGMLQFTTQR